MRILLPIVALSGCFYIDADDEQERLGWLTDGVGFTIVRVTPDAASLCASPPELTVESTVDGAWAGATFTASYRLDDDVTWTPLGEVTPDPAVGGTSALVLSFAPTLPGCAADTCEHTISIALSGPAEAVATAPDGLTVTAERPVTLTAVELVSDAATVDWADVVFASSPPQSVPVTTWDALRFELDDPFLAAGGDVAYDALACPLGADPDTDPSGCTSSDATAEGSTLTVATEPFADLCDELVALYVRASGHPCGAVLLAVGAPDARFVPDDCDDDQLDADEDCDDLDPTTGAASTWYADVDADSFGASDDSTEACSQPAGHVSNGDDCDDDDDAISPDAIEVCDADALDEDCDGDNNAAFCGTCEDGKQSGPLGETDVDCGGAECGVCGVEDACLVDADCATATCAGTCQPWSLVGSGNGDDIVADVAVAPDGEPVVLGQTRSSPFVLGGQSLASIGVEDGVVARFHTDGTLAWARRFGNANADLPLAVDVSATTDETAVAGAYAGSGSISGVTMTNAGDYDTLLIKYDAVGVASWVVGGGTVKADALFGVSFAADGDVFVAGGTNGDLLFGIPITGDLLVQRRAALDGAVVWTRTYTGDRSDIALASATHPSGDVIVGGGFGAANLSFTPATFNIGCRVLTTTGTTADAFVARFSGTDGSCVWATAITGTSDQLVDAVAVTPDGDVIVGGSTGAAAVVGSFQAGGAGKGDGFVARLNGATGVPSWARGLGGPNDDIVDSVAVDADGNVVASGRYQSGADLGGGAAPFRANNEVFVARYAATTGAWLAQGTWTEQGSVKRAVVATDVVTGNVLLATDSDGFLHLGDARKADPSGAYGLFLASIGPAPWRSTP